MKLNFFFYVCFQFRYPLLWYLFVFKSFAHFSIWLFFFICGVLYISWTQAPRWFLSLYSLSFRSLNRVFWWLEVSNFNIVQCTNFIPYRTSQFWLAIFQVLNSHLHCDSIGQSSSKVLLFCFFHINLLCS